MSYLHGGAAAVYYDRSRKDCDPYWRSRYERSFRADVGLHGGLGAAAVHDVEFKLDPSQLCSEYADYLYALIAASQIYVDDDTLNDDTPVTPPHREYPSAVEQEPVLLKNTTLHIQEVEVEPDGAEMMYDIKLFNVR